MKAPFCAAARSLLAASLAACSTAAASGRRAAGVEVARFHLGEPVARAQIAIEPFDRADSNRPEYPAYAAAVERQLTRLGWTVVPTSAQSEQVALDRSRPRAAARRSRR